MSLIKHKSTMHNGHRGRMRKKYREQGFDYFEIHEILEMLLYFIVPRRDTNPLSHNLLNHFGSFHEVFDAEIPQLMKFGLTENIASFLNYIPQISDYYMTDRLQTRSLFVYPEQIRSFLKNKYASDDVITTYVLLTDVNNRVLFCGVLAKGQVTKDNFPLDRLIELCLYHNAQAVHISHSYPKNAEVPNDVDKELSKYIRYGLADIFIPLKSHFISVFDNYDSLTEVKEFEENLKMLKKFLTFIFRNKEIDELCKNLLDYFGSFSGIFDANLSALKDFGLTDNVATYIKFIPDITRIYLEDKRKERFKYVYPDTLCSYFRYKYIGRNKEVLYGLLLDANYRVLYCGILSRGSLGSTQVPLNNIIELCFEYKPQYAVVSHNHPHTTSTPSDEDLIATEKLKKALKNIKVELIDHIIVSATDETALSSGEFKDRVYVS